MSVYKKKIICIVPVYNDWESFYVLYDKLNNLSKFSSEFFLEIVVVNDCSSYKYYSQVLETKIEILDLIINIGHQRAIAVGLQYVYSEKKDFDYVLVMDGDGEDVPEQITMIYNKSKIENDRKIIFAERNKRHESYFFKVGYYFYKRLFYLLTDQKISFGNFSLIPKQLLLHVVHLNSIWNHYSGGIIQSKIPFDKIKLDRGIRYHGKSKMNFNSLMLHGLSSISIYFDFLSLRILRYSIYGIILCIISVLIILFKKYISGTAIPGWASSLMLITIGIVIQLFSVTLIVLLMQLSLRRNIQPPNANIYKDFLKKQ